MARPMASSKRPSTRFTSAPTTSMEMSEPKPRGLTARPLSSAV